MSHLSREELERWWNEGAAADRQRIVAHLAECDDCAIAYGTIVDQRFEGLAAPATPTEALLTRGYDAVERHTPAETRRWPRYATVAAAAAAAAAAAILVALLPVRQVTPPSEAETAIRGSTIQALAPIGRVRSPITFEWASPVAAARFVVDVRTLDGQPLMQLSSNAQSITLAPPQASRLEADREYEWHVIGLDRDGAEIIRAPAQRFVVVGGAPARER